MYSQQPPRTPLLDRLFREESTVHTTTTRFIITTMPIQQPTITISLTITVEWQTKNQAIHSLLVAQITLITLTMLETPPA